LRRVVFVGDGRAETVYREKISGVRTDRPQLAKLMTSLKHGDVVLVTKLDRLGRSTRELLDLIECIGKAGAAFRSLGDPLWDTSSSQGRLLSTLLAAIAEFEQDLIRERTGEGRKRAWRQVRPQAEIVRLPVAGSPQAPCRRQDAGRDRQELHRRPQYDFAVALTAGNIFARVRLCLPTTAVEGGILRAAGLVGAAAMHLHIYRDKSRAGHIDIVGEGDHPWTIDLVTAVTATILVMGFAGALVAQLLR